MMKRSKQRLREVTALSEKRRKIGDAEINLEPEKLRQSLEFVAHLIEETPVFTRRKRLKIE